MKKLIKTLLIFAVLTLVLAAGAYASGEASAEPAAVEPVVAEASGEPSVEPEPPMTTFVYEGVEYTVPVYTFNGEEYVKLDDLKAVLSEEEEVAAEPVTEASGEPSAEPAASEEPAAEEPAAVTGSFDVTIRVNGSDYAVAPVNASVAGNTYTFQIGDLLAAFGMSLTYDEKTDVASITADVTSLLGALMLEEVPSESEQSASGEPSAEPAASEEPAANTASEEPVPAEDAAVEEAVPATDGTENQANVLAAAAQPATEEEHEAYEAYLVEYMNAYTGVGDGTFDDSARLMALGELDGVSFGSDVNAFPFEMFVTQFGALDFASYMASAAPAAETEAVPATDGTENQSNVLAATTQPATEEEHEAYEAYLVEYMNAYTGVGDGTFDDSARLMALGELDGVSFGSDVNAFPFEMFVTQFGALDYAAFAANR